MDPLTMGLITGGSSLLGSIFSSSTSASNTQAQIAASQQQQATQNAFTESMSNTAYQRASADMKAAGLNPMMMFGSGAAASTPSGSSIQAPMPQTTSPLAGLGSAVSKGVDAMVTAKTIDKMSEEIANLKTERGYIQAKTNSELPQPEYTRAQTRLTNATSVLRNLDVPPAKLKAQEATDILGMDPGVRAGRNQGDYLYGSSPLGKMGSVVGGAAGGINSAYHGVRDWWENRLHVPKGDSFSDRFNPVYGNSN